MRPTWPALLVLAACAVAVADEPAEVLADRDALTVDRAEAVGALRRAGRSSAVVEVLSKRVADPGEAWVERLACLGLAIELGTDGRAMKPILLSVLRGPDDSVGENLRLRAANALGAVAPDDQEAFDAVRAAMPQELDFLGSFWAEPLSRFGERAVPVFVEWLASDDAGARLMAARGLGACGPSAAPHLLRALSDDQHWIALAAAESLRRSGAPAEDVVPRVAALLDSENPRSRSAALDALSRFGRDAAPAAAKIRPFLVAPDVYTRIAATDALFLATGECDDASVDRVAEGLAVTNVPVHHRAAETLRDLGPRAKSALPRIARAMHRVTRETRATLCDAIGAMGDAAKPEGVEILRALLRGDPDPNPPAGPASRNPRNWDDTSGYQDLDAAVRAVGALRAKEAAPEVRRMLDLSEKPDTSEALRLLQRRARETLAALER